MKCEYYRTPDGHIITGYEISQAYKNYGTPTPFNEFKRQWLNQKKAVRDNSICTDDLVKADNLPEAARYFAALTGCTKERARNTVHTMKDAFNIN